YGISSPREIVATPFSTVTISGRASVRVLLGTRGASSARLTLYRLPVMPNAIPPAPPLATAGAPPRAEMTGRLTTFPPSGRPVNALIGSRPGNGLPAGTFGGPKTLATGWVPGTASE